MRYTLGYTSRFEFIMKAIGLGIEEIQNNRQVNSRKLK